MLMMRRDLGPNAGPATADAHDAPGFGPQRQGPAAADAHDAPRFGSQRQGPATADAHDAPRFGSESQGQQQLMLMMRRGLGPNTLGPKVSAKHSCAGIWFPTPGPATADAHDAPRFGFKVRASSS